MTASPGPGSPWPLDPQVPSYEQPGYPTPQPPYGPPQGYPTEPPSFFAPPGRPYQEQQYQGQPYVAQAYQGQPYVGPQFTGQQYSGQPPYGPQQSVYAPDGNAPPGGLPPDRVPASYGMMAIVAVVLIAVIGIGVGVWSMTSAPKTPAAAIWTPEPTSTSTRVRSTTAKPTSPDPSNCAGTIAETSDWRALVPTGWSCGYQAGSEVTVVDSTGDVIMVHATTADPSTACGSDLTRSGATVTALPDGRWGGLVTKTAGYELQGRQGQARCARATGFTYIMVGVVVSGTMDGLVAAETALAGGWTWKY